MAYCSESDISAAVGNDDLIAMSDRGNTGSINSAAVDAAIAEADGLIDSYAVKRYQVPLATVPTTIRTLSVRLAVRAMRRNARMAIPADVKDEEIDRKWLEDLAAGKVAPGVDPYPSKSSIVLDKAGQRESTKSVSRAKMKGFW